jgi:hypothetical protein
MDGSHLSLDAEAIGRKVAGDVEKLAGDDVPDSADDGEGDDADDCDREYARDAPGFKAANGRGEQKGECKSEGEGDKKLAGEEEDQDGYREGDEGPSPGKLATSSGRHTTSRSLMNEVACPGKNTSRWMMGAPDGEGCWLADGIMYRLRLGGLFAGGCTPHSANNGIVRSWSVTLQIKAFWGDTVSCQGGLRL